MIVKVRQHKLVLDDNTPAAYSKTPNVSAGKTLQPRYLVIHYTAGSSFQSSVSWLTSKEAKASAHLVIGRDGEIAQLARFDQVTWHAGVSRWRGLSGLNQHSIGIELDNAGRLQRGSSRWETWFGRIVDDADVIEAAHKNDGQPAAWHRYTPRQLELVTQIAAVLARHYQLIDVLGHDDIAPGRKSDPGPAFPLGAVRGRALGRERSSEVLAETTTVLNIRHRPGVEHPMLPESPLAKGSRLNLLSEEGAWCFAEVLDDAGQPFATGWVHGNYVRLL